MLTGVMMAQSVPCLENLATHNAWMRHVQMNLCVSLDSLLCVKDLSTGQTAVL